MKLTKNRFMRLINTFLFFLLFFICIPSFATDIRVLSDFFGKNFENNEEEGKIKINITLREFGSDKEIGEKTFNYRMDKINRTLEVTIPLGQYYISKTEAGFKAICDGGLASSGYEVSMYKSSLKSDVDLAVKNVWSCGSMGCSYYLTFGDREKLLKYCTGEN